MLYFVKPTDAIMACQTLTANNLKNNFFEQMLSSSRYFLIDLDETSHAYSFVIYLKFKNKVQYFIFGFYFLGLFSFESLEFLFHKETKNFDHLKKKLKTGFPKFYCELFSCASVSEH